MSNKTEDNTNVEYKNLDIELENAINLANESMQTVGERLLFVYNLAKQKGYNPFEARKIVETRIINISPSYLRRMLPNEAKHVEMRRPKFAPQVAQNIKASLLDSQSSRIIEEPKPINDDDVVIPTYEQELKVLAGQQTNKTEREIQEVVYKDAARSDRAELASVPIEQEKKIVEEQQVSSPIITRSNIWNVPPTRTRKLFMDIMKVRNLMEKTGLKINLDTFDVDI